MNILLVTYDLPYPLNSGGKVRAYHLLRSIAAHHRVHLLSFYRNEDQRKYLTEFSSMCVSVDLLKRRSVMSLMNLVHLPSYPFPAAIYVTPSQQTFIKSLINKYKIDLVHYESFYTTIFLDKGLAVPQLVATENIEWKIYVDYAKKQQNPLIKKILTFEAMRTKRFEINTWKQADGVIAVSEDNAKEITATIGKPTYIVSNGVDTSFYAFHPKKHVGNKKIDVLFVGNFHYVQNTDAVEWLLTSIWPKLQTAIRNNHFTVHLTIAGNGCGMFAKYQSDAITLVEKIDDMRTLYHQSDLLLAPIRIGSGTKFKVLEAMAVGLPVVTTRVGIEGIADSASIAIVEESADGLVAGVIDLVRDAKKRQQMIVQARAVIENHFDWNMIGKELEKVYGQIVNHHH